MLCNSTAQVYYQSTKRFNEEIEQSFRNQRLSPIIIVNADTPLLTLRNKR